MNEEMRNIIIDKRKELVANTDYDRFVAMCIEKELLTTDMLSNITRNNPNQKDCHEEIFKKITTRGPDAVELLRKILHEGKFKTALNILFPATTVTPPTQFTYANMMTSIQSTKRFKQELKLEPYTEEITLPDRKELHINVKKSSKIHSHSFLDTYPMKTPNRGILFLVNNINFENNQDYPKREGAEYDEYYLITLFREFGFTIFFYRDLTASEFKTYLDQFLRLNENKYCNAESLVFAVLSHGHTEGQSTKIVFKDGGMELPINIITRFNNQECPFMKYKPKIFLFPFCRGDIVDSGIKAIKKFQVDSKVKTIPEPVICSDMIICYGSIPGFQTIREVGLGSWYIELFCKILSECAHDTDFEECLRLINKKVMLRIAPMNDTTRGSYQGMQTPHVAKIDFNDILYFNPGFVSEES